MKIKMNTGLAILVCLMGCFGSIHAQSRKKTNSNRAVNHVTKMTGEIINSPADRDSLVIELKSEFGPGNTSLAADSTFTVLTRNHRFSVIMPALTRPVYVCLSLGSNIPVFYQYFFDPGDSIHVAYDQKTKALLFSGRGSAKFNWQNNMLVSTRRLNDSLPRLDFMKDPVAYLGQNETRLASQLNLLEAAKDGLTAQDYNILKADVIARNRLPVYDIMRLSTFGYGYDDPSMGPRLNDYYENKYYRLPADTINESYLKESGYYAIYLLARVKAAGEYNKFHRLPDKPALFEVMKKERPGVLRDKLIVTHVFNELNFSLASDSLLAAAMETVKDSTYHRVLAGLQERLGKGSLVRSFHFPDKTGKMVDLRELKGKVVLVDMWFTGCTGCVQVAKTMPAVEKQFEHDPQVVFVSLSIDKDKTKWLNSIDSSRLVNGSYTHYTSAATTYLYTGGSGTNNEFIKRYNMTNSYPCLVLIGKNGSIFSMNPSRPDMPGGQEKLIREIKEAVNN